MDGRQTAEEVRRFLKARVPVIVMRTVEPTRALAIVNEMANDFRQMPFFSYTRTEGLREVLSDSAVTDDYSLVAALDQAQQTFRSRANVNFVFSDLEDLENDSPTSRHFAQLIHLAERNSCAIILIGDRPVWSGLSRLGMTTTLDVPTVEELYEVVSSTIEPYRLSIPIEWQDLEIHRAAEILSGVTEGEAINVISTLLAKEEVRNDDLAELSQFKDRIFGALAGLERVRLQEDYKVGGLENLKEWLTSKQRLMTGDLTGWGVRPPKGVLLCGVPGCGKSLSAKAIAQEWELPLYRLDMAAIMGMYVGESESRLREALATADRAAPCVLWIDEIEKGLASGAGDNSVTRRLIGQFLFWMQESTSKVFLVATSNDVSTLPPELLRKGRFDAVFFVDLPTEEEREEILRLCFRRYTQCELTLDLLRDLVMLTDGFAGSDIDAVVNEVAEIMYTRQSRVLPDDLTITQHFRAVVPFSRSNPEEVAAIAGAIRPELRALVLLLADAGLRINEALALRRGDVTLGRGTAFVDVAHSLVHQGKSLVPGPTKTRRIRRVQITPATADVLADHLSAFAEPGPDGIVFPGFSDSSQYLRASSASRALREAMASAGVVIPAGRYGGWHAFRHYSATRFGQAGASTAAIMRRYGWSRPEQAMHYQRADADYERDVLDRMARLAGPEAETWSGRALEAADAGVVDLSSRRRRKA